MSTPRNPWKNPRYYDLPATLSWVDADGVTQSPVFDPAMKHRTDAYRASEPRFEHARQGARWRAARRRALDLVLEAVAGSAWSDALVLRGSALMALRFGAEAREPGDLDFVVVPHTWAMEDPGTARMLEEIARAAQSLSGWEAACPRFDARGAVTEDIWTYERVPGRRMVLPWSAPEASGLPGGSVQLDFVFNERLLQEPEPVELPGGGTVRAATLELSLAWKVLWLLCDRYPQGKDLYDAVLLAERVPLAQELLRPVLEDCEDWPYLRSLGLLTRAHLAEQLADVQWEEFVVDHPEFEGRRQEYTGRLLDALESTLDGFRLD
ncbi:nucleotidyl transferase AbiEii/AbiGii toxin family protein [Streptomyces sp. NPDC002734]|uniref:nucleotidyl transferase AbiEii/AbiGii toxin family protein n=1 Tax=Streptomyces sp. NPDC002734 TaxID=3154426 RepID=UPI0033294FCE